MRFATFLGEIIITFGPIIALLILWEKQDRAELLRELRQRIPSPTGSSSSIKIKRWAIGLLVFGASLTIAKLL
jgi:glycerol uptake facilitator-like aquaporin